MADVIKEINQMPDDELISQFHILFNIGRNNPDEYENKYRPMMREIAIETRRRHIL